MVEGGNKDSKAKEDEMGRDFDAQIFFVGCRCHWVEAYLDHAVTVSEVFLYYQVLPLVPQFLHLAY